MKYSLYTDGGSRGNPGPAAYGFVIYADHEVVAKKGGYVGETTNNVAEYMGLLEGLKELKNHTQGEVWVYMDSELIIKQMRGEYRVRDANLKDIYVQVQQIEAQFDKVHYTHVRREKNAVADKVVNQVLDKH